MELWIMLALLLVALWGWGHSLYWKGQTETLQKDMEKRVEEKLNLKLPEARKQAIAQSRAVLSGQVSEQWLPFFPDFPFNPAEARFLGAPIDMVVFDGLDTPNGQVQLYFLEIKTAKSTLSQRQKRIREAIEAGRVYWKEMRLQPQQTKRTG
jgi:predicted Holliday junction resolvase-like endonuclease